MMEPNRSLPALTDDRPSFDFDSMLMYGWVADATLRVWDINESLRNWMCGHKHPDLVEAVRERGVELERVLREAPEH